MRYVQIILALIICNISSHALALTCTAGPEAEWMQVKSLVLPESSSLIVSYRMPDGDEFSRVTLSYNIVYSPDAESALKYSLYYDDNLPFISAEQSSRGTDNFDDEDFSGLLQRIQKAYPDAIIWLEYELKNKKFCSKSTRFFQ